MASSTTLPMDCSSCGTWVECAATRCWPRAATACTGCDRNSGWRVAPTASSPTDPSFPATASRLGSIWVRPLPGIVIRLSFTRTPCTRPIPAARGKLALHLARRHPLAAGTETYRRCRRQHHALLQPVPQEVGLERAQLFRPRTHAVLLRIQRVFAACCNETRRSGVLGGRRPARRAGPGDRAEHAVVLSQSRRLREPPARCILHSLRTGERRLREGPLS